MSITSSNLSKSIYPLYHARATGELASTFTVPAFNLRGLPTLTARAALAAAKETETGTFVFELARSEMKYTNQTPSSFAQSVRMAAEEVGWNNPLFIQGDHYQAKAETHGVPKPGEVESLKELIKESLTAQIYNIDIDASTLVDLTKPTEAEQQRPNYTLVAELALLIRELQPEGIQVSIGGEIGEVGKSNSRPAELIAFMDGFNNLFNNPVGLSKLSIQTGTKHGGNIDQKGTIQPMSVDFTTISTLSELAQNRYKLGGVVQHGASTLSKNMFSRFPEAGTLEIHLSTGIQNLIFDHQLFPQDLKQEMYHWLDLNCQAERKETESDTQFHYRLRKKTWGPFGKTIDSLPSPILDAIFLTLKQEFIFYFSALNVRHTLPLLNTYYSK